MPALVPTLATIIAIAPAMAFATTHHFDAGNVNISFDTSTFTATVIDGNGTRDISPDGFGYSASSNGLTIDLRGLLDVSDFAQNESDDQQPSGGTLFGSFSFLAHPGHRITNYQLTITGSYDIELPGFVSFNFGNSPFASSSNGFNQSFSETYMQPGSSAVGGSFDAVGLVDMVQVQVGTELVQTGTEWIPDPGCTDPPSECPLVEQPVFEEVPIYEYQADLGLAALRFSTMTLTAVTAPVPEADRYTLLLVGLGALGLVSRRKQTLN